MSNKEPIDQFEMDLFFPEGLVKDADEPLLPPRRENADIDMDSLLVPSSPPIVEPPPPSPPAEPPEDDSGVAPSSGRAEVRKEENIQRGYGQGETVDGRTIRRYRGSGRPTGTSYELYRSMSNDARKRYRAMKEAEADAILAEMRKSLVSLRRLIARTKNAERQRLLALITRLAAPPPRRLVPRQLLQFALTPRLMSTLCQFSISQSRGRCSLRRERVACT